MTLAEAVSEFVADGHTVALEGFTHLIPFAAGHEIIRQGRRDLTLVRLTPDVLFDQLVAAGTARAVVFGWMGNAGMGSLHALRRRIEHADPEPLLVEEYSHYGLLGRYVAGASRLPFFPLRSYSGSDMPSVNPRIRKVASPFDDGDDTVWAVPPLNPDVAFVHAQRADRDGNTHIWGLTSVQKEAAFAARRTVVVVEEIVDDSVIRSDPSRTVIPAIAVDAVVEAPGGAHPSFAQGYYDRDNDFYRSWDAVSRDPSRLAAWLDEWVFGIEDSHAYRDKLGAAAWARLTPEPSLSGQVSYGHYPPAPATAGRP
jgi:glutaconate CoA-transferase subunit A